MYLYLSFDKSKIRITTINYLSRKNSYLPDKNINSLFIFLKNRLNVFLKNLSYFNGG